ncbi:MAG: head GIN domain-containing protein [Pseudomonadota bacterium]
MKKLIIASSLALVFATPAFAETQTFDLAGFTRVSAAAGTTVNVKVGGDYSVVAESTGKGLEKLRVELVGDELQIGRKHRTMSWGRSDRVTVTVTAPALSGLEVSSGASLDATGVDAGSFEIEASSGGSLDVSGRCDALNVEVSSGGSIDAEGLLCRTAIADASSGGNADIYASEGVTGDASSGGNVDVHGNPKNVSKDTSSGGSVSVE